MLNNLTKNEPENGKEQCKADKIELPDVENSRCTKSLASSSERVQNIETNQTNTNWKLSDFHLERRLGHGQYGKVYLVCEKATKYAYAMKKQLRVATPEIMVWREVGIQLDLCHRNILRLYGHFHDDTNIYLILEYAPNGSLRRRLDKQPEKRLDEKFAARCILSCADALNYLHERDIIHRDIKPENLLLGYNDELKIADFGLSINALNQRRTTICGTPDYIPPESVYSVSLLFLARTIFHFSIFFFTVMNGEPYSREVDLWSLGVLCYDMLVGEWAFKGANKEDQYWKTIKAYYNPFPDFLSKTAGHLIRRLIVVDPLRRLTISEVMKHPWIIANT